MDEQESHRLQELDKMKRLAWALSLAGFIPFLACTLIVVILGLENPLADPAIAIFRNYSVIILSFLGGIRWGHALLRESDDDATFDMFALMGSVVPSLIAWVTMFMPTTQALAILLVAYCAQGAWDSLSANNKRLPKWFAPIRITLTLIVAICHGAMFLIAA